MACPQCTQTAAVTATATTSSGFYHTERAEFECAACGLIESFPGADISSFLLERGTPSEADTIRHAIAADPAVSSTGPYGQGRREQFLRELQELLPCLTQEIKARSPPMSAVLRSAERPGNTLWTLRIYGHVSTVPDSVLCAGGVVPVAGSDKHNVPTCKWDEVISDVRLTDVKLVESPIHDPLGHWKADYQLAVLHVQRALDANDALEAAVRTLQLLQAAHRIGVASHWQLVVPAELVPKSKHWLWDYAAREPATPRTKLPETDIQSLAEYRAKGLQR